MCPAFTQAEIKQHPIGLQIWTPDTWTSEVDGDMLSVTSPDEGAVVILMVFDYQNIEMAIDEMDRELSQIIYNIRTTAFDENMVINGLKGVTEEGTGTIDGTRIDWLSGLFPYGNHALMILGVVDSNMYDTYQHMLVEILSSLKPY
jgi:hypothetical protein